MRSLIMFTAVLSVVALAVVLSEHRVSTAQETTPQATDASVPSATPSAYPLRSIRFSVLARTSVSVTTGSPVIVSAATIVLPPRAETVLLMTEGITVMSVQSGVITVTADQMTVGVTDVASAIGLEVAAASPEVTNTVELSPGSQVSLPAGATVSMRNDAGTPALVMIFTVVPTHAATTPTP